MLKLYIVWYETNFGLGVTIVRCSSEEELKTICDKSNYIWHPYTYKEITLENFPDQETIIT